jgi:hypothetical protein
VRRQRARAEHDLHARKAGLAKGPECIGHLLRGAGDDPGRLASALQRADVDPGRATDRRRVATDLVADGLQGGEPRPELLEVAALLRPPAPDVGMDGRVALPPGARCRRS